MPSRSQMPTLSRTDTHSGNVVTIATKPTLARAMPARAVDASVPFGGRPATRSMPRRRQRGHPLTHPRTLSTAQFGERKSRQT